MSHSLTVKKTDGKSDETAIDPTNSATATAAGATKFMTGPPLYGAARTQGRYIQEIAGTSGQYRHLRDEPIVGASPTAYSYVPT